MLDKYEIIEKYGPTDGAVIHRGRIARAVLSFAKEHGLGKGSIAQAQLRRHQREVQEAESVLIRWHGEKVIV